MNLHSTKTDNANLSHKIQLRKLATKDLKEIKVLDLFAGENLLWQDFKLSKYYGVEIVKGKGKNLTANNERVIESLDLSKFNVIDCDSYGIPYKQIEKILENPTLQKNTVIIYTAIGNGMSQLSKVAIKEFGFQEMYKKNKVLLNKLSNKLFHAFLQKKGVKEVWEYEEYSPTYKKQYGFFKL